MDILNSYQWPEPGQPQSSTNIQTGNAGEIAQAYG
jgi:hypothetical protein